MLPVHDKVLQKALLGLADAAQHVPRSEDALPSALPTPTPPHARTQSGYPCLRQVRGHRERGCEGDGWMGEAHVRFVRRLLTYRSRCSFGEMQTPLRAGGGGFDASSDKSEPCYWPGRRS